MAIGKNQDFLAERDTVLDANEELEHTKQSDLAGWPLALASCLLSHIP
jgi:hypothetical protein